MYRYSELAVEAELRGFSSGSYPNTSHTLKSKNPVPAVSGIASEYPRLPDPNLAAAASVTTRIRLELEFFVAQHDPINLAKAPPLLTQFLMTFWRVSVTDGIVKKCYNGVEFSTRRERVRETMLAVKELWTKEEAEFHGKFVNFDPSWTWPKPVQEKWSKSLIGGASGPTIFNHIAEFGNGWMPIGGSGVKASLAELKKFVIPKIGLNFNYSIWNNRKEENSVTLKN